MHPTRPTFVFRRHDPDPPEGGTGGEGGGDGGTGSGEGGSGDGGDQFTPITSQADLDRVVQSRIARERSRFADYDQLKDKASKWDEHETSQMDELTREKTARETAEANAAASADRANQTLIRAEVIAQAAEANVLSPSDVHALLATLPADQRPTVDTDGNVTGAKEAVAAILQSRPHLVRKADEGPGRLPGQGGGNGSGTEGGRIDPTDRKAVAAEARKLGVRL